MGSSNCNILAGGDDQKNIILWRLTNTAPKMTLTGQSTEASTLEFNEGATKLYTGTVGGTAHIWDLTKACEITKLRGHQTTCTSIASSIGDEYVVTGS